MLIFARVLNCEDLLLDERSLKALFISLATTIYNIFMTFYSAKVEAEALDAECLTHMMINMTANNDWVPYMHLINDENYPLKYSVDLS